MTMTYHDHPYHDFLVRWGFDFHGFVDGFAATARLDMVHFLDDFTARGLFEGLTSVLCLAFGELGELVLIKNYEAT